MTYHDYKNPCRCGGKKGFMSKKCKNCGKWKEESIKAKVDEIIKQNHLKVKTFSENGWTCDKCENSKSSYCPRHPDVRDFDRHGAVARIYKEVTNSDICPFIGAT